MTCFELGLSRQLLPIQPHQQCDQIGQFIALWATFKAFGDNYYARIAHIIILFL